MKLVTLCLLGIMSAMLLGGCCCNPGYYAPAYKPCIIGCTAAIVPAQ